MAENSDFESVDVCTWTYLMIWMPFLRFSIAFLSWFADFKNFVPCFIYDILEKVHFWFYGQKICFSVPRAMPNLSFQSYIQLTLLKILLSVKKFLKHIVGSNKNIFPCVSNGKSDQIISDSRNPG